MPVIVQTRVGVVREVFGSAVFIAADGSQRPVQAGDVVRAGDVILTQQNSFVEIAQDAAPVLAAAAASETDRVISALAAGDPAAAPAAGLAGGDGSGLGPGLRVDRINETLTPGALQTLPTDGELVTAIDSNETEVPEDQLAGGPGPTLSVDAPDNSFDTTPTITGSTTLSPGRIVTLTVTDAAGNTQTFFTTVNADGSFSADVPLPLAEGDYTVVASGSDNIGRVASDSDPGSIIVNAPLPPVVTVSAPELTDDSTPTLTGTTDAVAGTTVTLTITDAAGAVQTVTAVVRPDGTYSVDVATPLAEGPYVVVASVTTAGGTATDTDNGVIDTTPPAPTITLDPITGDDVVNLAEGGQAEITLSGRVGGDARPGDTVTVTVGGQDFVTTVAADGSFSVEVSGAALVAAVAGGVAASVTSVDAAGNSASASVTRPYTLDAAPVAVDDTLRQPEDGPPGRGDLTPGTAGQDSDPEGGPITVRGVAAGGGTPGGTGVGSAVVGDWGSLVVQADGRFVYTPGAIAQSLRAGETVTDTFSYTIVDPQGNTDTATLTVTLVGANDVAVIGGDVTGRVVEDGVLVSSGVLTVSDADAGEAAFRLQTGVAGDYGRFSVDSQGRWSYTLDNAADRVQALAGGETVTENFTVTSSDGTTRQVTVTVVGTDDAPVVSVGTGEVVEDVALLASGTLTVGDIDSAPPTFLASLQSSDYGSLAVASNGEWRYTLGVGEQVQKLAAGEIVTDVFPVTLSDGSTTTVTITITGTDDAPVVSAGTGAVIEDKQPSTSGQLTATDIDGPAPTFIAGTLAGDWGSLVLGSDGRWTYTLGEEAQALAQDEVVTDVITVLLSDGSTTTVTITVTGTDDLPVISIGTGAVVEDTSPTATGTLTATDVDNPALAFVAGAQNGTFGALTLAATGQWSYTLGAAAQALGEGEVVVERFTVNLNDGSTTTVTITVTGTDDPAVILPVVVALVETDAVLSTGGVLTITDPDSTPSFVPQAATAGTYGSFTLAADGTWTYTASSPHDEFVAGQVYIDTFTVTSSDGSTSTVTINITGTNDPAVIPPVVVELTETNSVLTTGGTLAITDPDSPLTFVPQTAAAGTYGSFTLAADGTWTYTASSAHDEFVAGQVYTDTFTVTSADGSTSTVTINITGTNDPALIPPVVVELTETNSVLTTGGLLSITDPDSPLTFVPQTAAVGTYGSFTLAADGSWTYTAASAHDEFVAGQVYTDTFTVTSADGSTSTVTVNITGTNDPAVIPPVVVDLTETNAVLTTGGLLSITDPDSPLTFVPQTAAAGTYGSFTLAADGSWTYTASSAHDEFVAGQVYTDTFTVTSADGSTSTVTINITGTNDPAVIPPAVVELTETNSVLTTGGTLAISDPDSPLTFVPQTAAAGAYGSFTLAADGTWTYTASSAHDEFVAGQVYTDTFSVTSADGSTSTVTINITGTNDPALIPPVVVELTESNSVLTTGGLLSITDPDSPLTFVPQTAAAGTYGSFTLVADGSWTYTASSAHDEFVAGQVYTDTFTVTSADGSTSTVTINITGTNDPAVIPPLVVELTETNSVLTTGGVLAISDPDSPLTFVPQTAVAGTYGTFTLSSAGAWTYTASSAHDEFVAGQVYTDTFTVTSADGSTSTVTINITGTNDPAVIPPVVVDLTETNAVLTTGGVLSITDPDSPLTFVPQTAAVGTYGSFTLSSDGAWTYTASSAHDEFAAGQVYTDTFTVTSADGSTSTVTINITGTNDAPVAVADTASAREAGGVANGTPGVNPTGNVLTNDTDPDRPDTKTVTAVGGIAAGVVGGGTEGQFGVLVLAANGSYTYTVNNNLAAVQALQAGGATLTDTFTYTMRDTAGQTSSTTLTVTISGSNDAPVAVVDTATMAEDGTLQAINVLGNDSDVDAGAVLRVTSATSGNGTVSINADNTLRFTPATDFNGTATIRYTVSDGLGGTANSTVRVTVTPVNDAPTTRASSSVLAAVNEDTANPPGATVSSLFTATFSDLRDSGNPSQNQFAGVAVVGNSATAAQGRWQYSLDGGTTWLDVGSASDGAALALRGTDRLRFLPAADYNGTPAPLSARLLDNSQPVTGGAVLDASINGGITPISTGVVALNTRIIPVNDAPVAPNGSIVATEEGADVAAGLSAPFDIDSPTLTVRVSALPSIGQIILKSGGTETVLSLNDSLTPTQVTQLFYRPPQDYVPGTDVGRLQVRVSDGQLSSTGQLNIIVRPVDDAPVARAGSSSGNEDSGPVPVALGGTDIDSTVTAVTVTVLPAGGRLLLADGVSPVVAGAALTPAQAANLLFVPNLNFNGKVTLQFTITSTDETTADPNDRRVSAPASHDITIAPVNDAPVASSTTVTAVEQGVAVSLGLASPSDVDDPTPSLIITVTQVPTVGVVLLSAGDLTSVVSIGQTLSAAQLQALVYLPPLAYDNAAVLVPAGQLGYEVTDNKIVVSAAATIDLQPFNDAPTASNVTVRAPNTALPIEFTLAGSDVDGSITAFVVNAPLPTVGRLELLDGTPFAGGNISGAGPLTLRFIPAGGFNGTATFSYQVVDNGVTWPGGTLPSKPSAPATIQLDYTGGVGEPVIKIEVDGTEDTPLPFTTVDAGTPGSVISVTNLPDHGSLTYPDGSPVRVGDTLTPEQASALVYTPDPDFNGEDTLGFVVTDPGGNSTLGQLTINIEPVPDRPVAVDDTVNPTLPLRPTEDVPYTFKVLGNDFDVDGQTAQLRVTSINGQPIAPLGTVVIPQGTVTLQADGTLLFVPRPDFNGPASFSYGITDPDGLTSAVDGVVSFNVLPVNDPPKAVNDSFSIDEDTGGNFNLVANDTDVDGGPLFVSQVGQGASGSVVLQPDGTVTYTPKPNFNGTDTFSYTVADGKGGVSSAVVTVTVRPVNDAPTASNTRISGDEDTPISGRLPAASDVDGDPVTYAAATAPAHGSVVINADGSYVYTPAEDYAGADRFTYTVSDGKGGSNTYTVDVTLRPVNDPPEVISRTLTVSEEAAAVSLGAAASDPDTNDTLTISITALPADGLGEVLLDGVEVSVGQQLTAAELARLTYLAPTDYDGLTPAGSFKYTVSDGLVTSVGEIVIDLQPVNDAPVNTVPGARTVLEDTPLPITGLSVADVDALGGTISVTLGVANGSLQVSGGTATITGSGTGNVTLSGTLAQINATLAASVSYTGKPNFNGADTLTMTTNDGGNTGSGGAKVDVDVVSITVTSVNDAPSGSDSTITMAEDGRHTFSAANFGFSDSLDTSPNTLAAVIVTTLPTAGRLTLSGASVTVGQSVSAADLSAGRLEFAPAENANGNGYAAFTFQVRDNGGTANGGVNLDPTANTITFDVSAVNDAPVARNDLPTALAVAGTSVAVNGNVITGAGSGNVADTDVENAAPRITGLAPGITESVLGTAVIGAPVTVKGVYGSLQLSAGGDYSYTIDNTDPDTLGLTPGARVTDVFSYTITDSGVSGAGGALTDTGQVTIAVAGPVVGLAGGAPASGGFLVGGAGDDVLTSGPGWDRLTGGGGGDTFVWKASSRGEAGNTLRPQDTLTDFDPRAAASGGDVLDLRDLLVGETPATLDRFLDFHVIVGAMPSTEIRISSTGGFSGGAYDSAAEDQRIVLEGVDIRASLGLAANASDNLIVQALIDRSKLLVDA